MMPQNLQSISSPGHKRPTIDKNESEKGLQINNLLRRLVKPDADKSTLMLLGYHANETESLSYRFSYLIQEILN